MTHAERIREAERKVLHEARKVWIDSCPAGWDADTHLMHPTVNASMRDCWAMFAAIGEMERLESQTCPKCGGTGGTWSVWNGGERGDWITCPAGCDNGRKREEAK